MAPDAIRWRAFEFPADVASCAVECGMHSRQCEPGELQVIKFHSKPVVHAVALLASCRKVREHVSGTGRPLIIGCVTGITLSRQPLKLSCSGPLVTGVAVQSGMGAEQGEAILVLLDLLHRHPPSLDRMALRAIGSKLTLMNVGVTVGAPSSHVGEHRLDVTLNASYILMHATKWIPR